MGCKGWNQSRLTDFNVNVDLRSVVEQVLQQVIAVLLLAPLLDGPQDVLEILGDPRSLLTQSSGSAVDTASRFQDVALENDIDHARELVLRRELSGLQGTDRLGNLDTLRL